MGELDFERYVAEFEAETARLGAAVTSLDPAAGLPTCPEWTVRDLVSHVGTGHRWSSGIVEGRLSTYPAYVLVEAPREPPEWPDWLMAGAHRLVAAIREAGPATAVWTWRPDRTAGFWLRRMLHDEIIHRYDVELAAGDPGEVAPDLAADGISDLFDTCATLSRPENDRGAFGGLAGAGETLHVHAAEAGLGEAGEWFAERTPAGVTWRPGHAKADVAVRGPVRDLLLVLNRRLGPDTPGVEILGDRALFEHWLAHSQF